MTASAGPGVQFANGVEVGSTSSQVRDAFPDVDLETVSGTGFVSLSESTDLRLDFEAGKVSSMLLTQVGQTCVN